jgi:hypothetical protein
MADEVGALAAVEIDPSLGVLRFFTPLETTWVKATVGENLTTLKKILGGRWPSW